MYNYIGCSLIVIIRDSIAKLRFNYNYRVSGIIYRTILKLNIRHLSAYFYFLKGDI